MKSFILRFLLGVFALGFVATSGLAQTQAGAIKAMKVSGEVSRIDSAGVTTPVADGTLLTESDTIVTGANSRVVLVFMNGASVMLGANSRLLVEQFKMDPLNDSIAVGQLKGEPSVSQTTLNLSYGELVGDVKKLNKSSTYNIKTAVGAAGIRGTTFRIVVQPSANGKTFAFSLATSEGVVVFTGIAADSLPVAVVAGTQVSASAEIGTTDGAVTSSQTGVTAISSDAAAAIEIALFDVINPAQATGVFTPAEQQQAADGGDAAGAQAGGAPADAPADSPIDLPSTTEALPTAPTVVSPT